MLPRADLKSADIKPTPQSDKIIGSTFHLFDEARQARRKDPGNGDPVKSLLLPFDIFVMMKVDSSLHFTKTIRFDMSGNPRINLIRFVGSLFVAEQKCTIENLGRIANGRSFENFYYLENDRADCEDYTGEPPIIAVRLAFEILEINPLCLQFFGSFSQMLQLRVQPSIHAPRLAAHGESHCLLMLSTLLFIAAHHLTDGISRSEYCSATGNQSLEIKNQITQPVTATLIGYYTRLAENNGQGDTEEAHKCCENEQSLFVKIRQIGPLKRFKRIKQVALFVSLEKHIEEDRSIGARSATWLKSSLAELSLWHQGHDLSTSSLGTLYVFYTSQGFASYRHQSHQAFFETLAFSSQAFWRVLGDRRARTPTTQDHQGKPTGYCSVGSGFRDDGLHWLTGSPKPTKLMPSSKTCFSSGIPSPTAYLRIEHNTSASTEHSPWKEFCRP